VQMKGFFLKYIYIYLQFLFILGFKKIIFFNFLMFDDFSINHVNALYFCC